MDHRHALAISKDLGQRVLRLIETVRDSSDLSPEAIGRSTGLQIETDPGDPRVYGFGKALDERWVCNLIALPEPGSDEPAQRMVFAFDDQTGRYDDMTAVCGLDFDDYAQALTAAGYTQRMNLGPENAFQSFGFRRGKVDLEILVRAQNAENSRRLCVSSLIIDAAGVRHA